MDQRYAELLHQYQEKTKKQQQTQKLYDAIKQKVQLEMMGSVANNDVTQTLQSINSLRQPEQTCAGPGTHEILESTIPRYAPVHDGLERLHPHQRSGSSAAGSGSDHMKMPPPENPRIPRLGMEAALTNTTLLTRSSQLGELSDSFTKSDFARAATA